MEMSRDQLQWRKRRLGKACSILCVAQSGLTIPFWVCLGAGAQQSVVASATTETLDQVPRVPGLTTLFRGTNAGISFSGIHTSSIGWYELATPGVSYTFTDHYSLDASGLVYLHRLVERSSVGPQPTNRLVLDAVDVGDTSISFHGNYHPHIFYDAASASLTAPTGNRSAGLGTGEVTFNFDNLMERYVRQAGFLVDLGVGDSSSLASNLVNQNYSSVGMLAHLVQTGDDVLAPGPFVRSIHRHTRNCRWVARRSTGNKPRRLESAGRRRLECHYEHERERRQRLYHAGRYSADRSPYAIGLLQSQPAPASGYSGYWNDVCAAWRVAAEAFVDDGSRASRGRGT